MITINGPTKNYGEVLAVNQASFTVSPGTITGFLGPNDAGKPTAPPSSRCPGAVSSSWPRPSWPRASAQRPSSSWCRCATEAPPPCWVSRACSPTRLRLRAWRRRGCSPSSWPAGPSYVLPFSSGKALIPEVSGVELPRMGLAALGQVAVTAAVAVPAWWITEHRDAA